LGVPALPVVPVPEPPTDVPGAEEPVPALLERLGADGVHQLRSRYAEVIARVNERTQDPARRDELKASAERLNPDSWQTPEEVTRGLEEYETVFASLRQIVGHKRRRRRRGRRGTPTPAATGALTPGTVDASQPEPPESIADDEPDLDGVPDDDPGGEEGSGEL
jgi:hypothetical protein